MDLLTDKFRFLKTQSADRTVSSFKDSSVQLEWFENWDVLYPAKYHKIECTGIFPQHLRRGVNLSENILKRRAWRSIYLSATVIKQHAIGEFI